MVLKIKQLSVSRGVSFKSLALFFSHPFNIGTVHALKMVNFIKGAHKLIIKFLSCRLNIRFYNKLSKETENSRDLEDKYIYTRH